MPGSVHDPCDRNLSVCRFAGRRVSGGSAALPAPGSSAPGSEGGEHYWVAGHGALVGGPHRPQKALTRSGSLRLRVNALGWSGCRAIWANSSEAIRSEVPSVKYCIKSQLFSPPYFPACQETF